ncbi:MAG: nuclear transport factor 2 family protein [Myxococcales bacterium]|nr:nuclear transport factor 2 family protein [Myxococcales bacterium]
MIRDMYAALTADDASAPGRLFTPDFYAFDGGKRFTGPELFALIKDAHAAGRSFVWNVVAPDVHLACDVAWVTWENRGSIAEATNVKAMTWLESAVLRWDGGGWRATFFHSTRVPPPKSPPPAE